MSLTNRLKLTFSQIMEEYQSLIPGVRVLYDNPIDNQGMFFGSPKYYWHELDNQQKHKQMQLTRVFAELAEVIKVLLNSAPESLYREFSDAKKGVNIWLQFDQNFSLKPDLQTNLNSLKEDAQALENVIDILSQGTQKTVIIPDTNCLLSHPDPVQYRASVNSNGFDFLLLPTVLGELDDHKINHRNSDVREKAKKCIKRIKGWRNQGSLRYGVIVDSNISVKAVHKEPDMDNTLSWLDRDNKDDRIIANVLAIQADEPSSKLVLFTGDINLQNKADAAYIEVDEI